MPFTAAISTYQTALHRLRALQAKRTETASLPDAFRRDAGEIPAVDLIRNARVARQELRTAVSEIVCAAARGGFTKSEVIRRLQSDIDALVATKVLINDVLLTTEVVGWIVEDYPVDVDGDKTTHRRQTGRRQVISIDTGRSERAG